MAIRTRNVDARDSVAREYRTCFLDAPGGAADVLQLLIGCPEKVRLEKVIVEPRVAGDGATTFDVEVETSAAVFAKAVNEMPADTTAGTVAFYDKDSAVALTETTCMKNGIIRVVVGAGGDPTAFIGNITFVLNHKLAE